MASSDARPVPRKNTAFRHSFAVRKNDGTLITTWTGMDSEVSIDGAAFADCTAEATEIGTSGCGYLDLTAAEMNGDCVLLKVTVTNTGALPLVMTFFPEESGDYRVDQSTLATQSSVNTIDDFLDTEIAAIKVKTDSLTFTVAGKVDANPTHWAGTAVATPTVAGVPEVDVTFVAGVAAGASDGTATAGGLSTITLAVGSSAADDIYNGRTVTIVGGTGAGQSRVISDYAGSTRIATVAPAWATAPDATSVYVLDQHAGAIDATEVAAIKAKTDQLTFTVANSVDATATASLGTNAPAGWINAAAIASDAITAAKVAADVAAEISAKVWVDVPAGTPVEDIAEGVWEYATRTLTAAGLDSIVVETGINARQALALIGAGVAGKASGLDTSTATFYAMGAAGTATARILATTADGNRTATTLTVPA